ncbi:hypothetical protein A2U01_0038187, partial [Trifolium medium]|nr:hypothetical protein [Trifolium medium]
MRCRFGTATEVMAHDGGGDGALPFLQFLVVEDGGLNGGEEGCEIEVVMKGEWCGGFHAAQM